MTAEVLLTGLLGWQSTGFPCLEFDSRVSSRDGYGGQVRQGVFFSGSPIHIGVSSIDTQHIFPPKKEHTDRAPVQDVCTVRVTVPVQRVCRHNSTHSGNKKIREMAESKILILNHTDFLYDVINMLLVNTDSFKTFWVDLEYFKILLSSISSFGKLRAQRPCIHKCVPVWFPAQNRTSEIPACRACSNLRQSNSHSPMS